MTLDSSPTNPDDGEQVLEVRAVDVADACQLLRTDGEQFGKLINLAL